MIECAAAGATSQHVEFQGKRSGNQPSYEHCATIGAMNTCLIVINIL